MDDKGGLHPERWSVQYLGAASFVQVKGLRPGRCYAARATALPHVTSVHPGLEVVVVPSPPSDTLLVNTLPCPPMGQPSPQLASRLKKELKVGGPGWCACMGWRGLVQALGRGYAAPHASLCGMLHGSLPTLNECLLPSYLPTVQVGGA